jgi:hypothetical protein
MSDKTFGLCHLMIVMVLSSYSFCLTLNVLTGIVQVLYHLKNQGNFRQNDALPKGMAVKMSYWSTGQLVNRSTGQRVEDPR